MFTRILLAVDGTQSGEAAVSFATALARRFDSLSGSSTSTSSSSAGAATPPRPSSRAWRSLMERWRTPQRGCHGRRCPLPGQCFTIADRIAEAAKGWGADIIVLGSKRRRWFSRFGGAGLRERVTGITGLPVLTAPAPLRMARRNSARELQLIVPVPVDNPSVVR